jgi:uncharacterized protein YjbI with pentapeptide repeats
MRSSYSGVTSTTTGHCSARLKLIYAMMTYAMLTYAMLTYAMMTYAMMTYAMLTYAAFLSSADPYFYH